MTRPSLIVTKRKCFELLIVEDDSADVDLTREAFSLSTEAPAPIHISVVEDGDKVMDFLEKRGEFEDAARPDLILLDLNLPRKGGLEVLTDLKSDDRFKNIPVVVLTTSDAKKDLNES